MSRRLIDISIVACALAALAVSLFAYRASREALDAQPSVRVALLRSIASDLASQASIRQELGEARFVEQDRGALGSYLAKIRRDGLPAHAEMRHKLEAIANGNRSILTLLEIYEPYAHTEEFKREASAFRAYAPAWNDRWDSLMEYFMAGGNLPASDVQLPTKFASAVQAELDAVK